MNQTTEIFNSDLYFANDAHSAIARPIARSTAAIFAWLLPARPSFRPRTGCIFRTGAQKETVSRFGAGAAENWPVIWFGLEYALTVDVGRCGHGDR